MSPTILLTLLSSPSAVAEGKFSAFAEIEVKLQIVEAERIETEVTVVDLDLGAYRVAVNVLTTGGDYERKEASYLIITDVEPHEAMAMTYVMGEATFAFSANTLPYDLEGSTEEEMYAWLDEMVVEGFAVARVLP